MIVSLFIERGQYDSDNGELFTITDLTETKNLAAQQASKTVAVLVPLRPTAELTREEQISLRHLMHFLGKYDKYLVVPKSLKVDYPGFRIKRFNDKYFGSTSAHGKLLSSPLFYKPFRKYKYILIYHLDALIFSDQLMEWCETDLDYIGAPFIKCEDSPWVTVSRVGNMGFSLIKIESILKVFYSKIYDVEPDKYWEEFCAKNPKYVQYLNFPRKYLKRLRLFNGARWAISRYRCNLDYFLSDEGIRFYPEFRVASFERGLRFAFEVAPRLCFELNKQELPFGCHAWHRYDREFWEPHLLK